MRLYSNMHAIQKGDSNDAPVASYTRGIDLSGSLEGAGGIGGLPARTDGYNSSTGAWTNNDFYFADANGNVTSLIDEDQDIVASYLYDPFGNTVSQSGIMADANVYRFSSKEIHAPSGVYYYGYRFYDPSLQRWISRDPIGEAGFKSLPPHQANPLSNEGNLYFFVDNEPTAGIDALGLLSYRYRPCNDIEQLACSVQCAETGVKSCTVTEIWGKGPDGQPVRYFIDPDCQCNPHPPQHKRIKRPSPINQCH